MMKRKIVACLTAVWLSAALTVQPLLPVFAAEYEVSDLESLSGADEAEHGASASERTAGRTGEEQMDTVSDEDDLQDSAEETPEDGAAESEDMMEGNAEQTVEPDAETADVQNSDVPEDVVVVHNEGNDLIEKDPDEGRFRTYDYYEDVENAVGGIIPVIGYQETEEEMLQEEELVGASATPSRYIPSVKTVINEQGTKKTCWAYSAMTCAERSLLEGGVCDSVNLSEKHMLYGYYNREGERGLPVAGCRWWNTTGSMYMPVAAMAELLGAADESLYPYTTEAVPEEEVTNDIADLDEAIFLPNYSTDSEKWKGESWQRVTESIKSYVQKNGAVWLSVKAIGKSGKSQWYTPWPTKTAEAGGTVTITYDDKPSADHAVTIIGWDDNKVISGAENPGAFYVQNSWGTGVNGGYVWISYEDASLTNPVSYHMEQSPLGKVRDTEVFSHTGAGYNGKTFNYGAECFGVNVYKADGSTFIDRAGFYTSGSRYYEVELFTDIANVKNPAGGTVAASASGYVEGAGFHKVDLDNEVLIEKGETFAVKVTSHNADGASYYMTFEGKSSELREITCEAGDSYIYVNGKIYDCATSNLSINGKKVREEYHSPCIYAYGRKNESLYIESDAETVKPGGSVLLKAVYEGDEGSGTVEPKWTADSKSVSIAKDGRVKIASSALTEYVTIRAEYEGHTAEFLLRIEADAQASKVSGLKVLGIAGTSLVAGPGAVSDEEGVYAVALGRTTDPQLRFIISDAGSGYYRIENFYTGLALSVEDEMDVLGVHVVSEKWDGEDCQRWRILAVKDGYIIQNKKNGLLLTFNDPLGEEYDSIFACGRNLQTAQLWTINASSLTIAKAKITLPASAAYTGKAVQVKPKITYGYRTLREGSDYTLQYSKNTEPGEALVTVSGTGYMRGTCSGKFAIVKSVSKVTSGKNYMIVPVKGPKAAVTVEKGGMLPNTRIYLSSQTGSEAQKFIFRQNSDGTYTITDQKSDYVMGIRGDQTNNAASLETQPDKGDAIRRWKLRKNDDGSWAVINAATDKAIYLKGGGIAPGTYMGQYTYSGSGNMRFYLVETTAAAHTYSNTYTVRAAGKTGLALEIEGASKAGGANARIYTYQGGAAQKFRLMYSAGGYYRIVNINSGKVLGIKGDSSANGTNVRQAAWNASPGQRFKPVKNADGSITFISAAGTALDINGGVLTAGRNVDSWASNGSAAQKWKLVKVT